MKTIGIVNQLQHTPGIEDSLPVFTYTTGDEVTLSCSLGVGDDGAAPHAIKWFVVFIVEGFEFISAYWQSFHILI